MNVKGIIVIKTLVMIMGYPMPLHNIPSPPAGITNSNYHRHQTLRTQLSAFLFRETRHQPRSQVLSQQQGRPT